MNKYLKIALISLGAVAVVGSAAFFGLKWKNGSKNNSAIQTPTSGNQATGTTGTTGGTGNQASKQYTLSIEKLKVSAPVILDVDGNKMEDYMKALEGGVAQMARTALPGEAGNTVIFGHSSYYVSKPGNYKGVFSALDKLSVGDKIEIKSTDTTKTYVVSGAKIVKPADLSVVTQDKNQHLLTLLTCWPPKTTTNRYVVVAKLAQ